MSENRSDKLVRELMGLFAKYGEADFRKAIEKMQNGVIPSLIVRAAQSRPRPAQHAFKAAAPVQSPAKAKSNRHRYEALIEELSSGNRDEVELARFLQDIERLKYFESVRQLSEYASRIGVSPIKSPDRYGTYIRIARALLELNAEDRRDLMHVARSMQSKSSSLSEWSKIIVKDRS